jgi:GxxExxY protein
MFDREVFRRDECFQIQGAVFDVYREMGCGFLEAAYQECLAKELSKRHIPFVAHRELKLTYKGQSLQQSYILDFVCYESIVVELKVLASITKQHKAQMLNYLKVSGMHVGLLANFGSHPKATVERILL